MTAGPAFGVIIPARYGSTRLPGKALLDLGGKPMIVRVLEVAQLAGAAFTLVATDDERIARAVHEAGGEAVLTSPDHATGTDRLAEVARVKQLDPQLIVVNLQGDEPALPASLLSTVAAALQATPAAAIATLATPLRLRTEAFDPNLVKVVTDRDGLALYFSRAPIPWLRGDFGWTPGAAPLPAGVPFLRHIGVYAYRVGRLLELSAASSAPLELAESLEQLRALWLGMRIRVAVIDEAPPAGVDTEDDARRIQLHYAR